MTMTRFTEPLKTRKANRIPGSTELVLTATARDVNGNEYPSGTHIVPNAGGYDNGLNAKYQDVVVL